MGTTENTLIPRMVVPTPPQAPSPCVITIITNGQGSILLGKRRDTKKWTLCAGHIENQESPEEAAYREIYEETGLTAQYLTSIPFKAPAHLHFFSTFCTGTPHSGLDPDNEVEKWVWVDPRNGIPSNIWDKLAGPEGEANILRQLFTTQLGLKKSEQRWLEADFMELQKSNKLLNHPDPRERALAIKLSTTSPTDLSTAILDPDPTVWQKAFNHASGTHALNTLSQSTRDSAGTPLFDRHDHLLHDPRCTPRHVLNIEEAIRSDTNLDPKIQLQRLSQLKRHPMYPKSLHKGGENWAHKYMADAGEVEIPSKIHYEDEPLKHKDLLDHYNQHVNAAKPLMPEDADLHTTGVASPKLVYKTDTHKLMVKPYFENENQQAGWNETSSQHLYDAAGLGHLHQRSFIASHGSGYNAVPVVGINIEKATPLHDIHREDLLKVNPKADAQARHIGIMDFLLGNERGNNLMVGPSNNLLAVDHANAFNYSFRPSPMGKDYYPTLMEGNDFHRYTTAAMSHLTESTYQPEGQTKYLETIKNWWPSVASNVRKAFQERLDLVKDPELKSHLQQGFNVRHLWLDNASKNGADHFEGALKKALGDAGFLHTQHDSNKSFAGAGTGGVHAKLMTSHPKEINEGVAHFENNINKHSETMKPLGTSKTGLRGIAPKAHYEHSGKGYIVKPAVEPHTRLAAWNELTSQALYHAGGIGHLHQNAHATVGNTGMAGADQAHGTAIHMEPGAMTMMDAMGGYKGTNPDLFTQIEGTKGQDVRRGALATTNTKHRQSLKQIGLMDYLTSNQDRHGNNIMLKPDGQPLAIDNSLAFKNDRKHAYGAEHYGENVGPDSEHTLALAVDPNYQRSLFQGFESRIGKYEGLEPHANALYQDATVLGGHPDDETYKWFDENKDKMLQKFQEHVNMLPGKEKRDRMMASYMVRHNHLSELSKQYQERQEIPKAAEAAPTALHDTILDPSTDKTTLREK
jgi:8-oxo-dGTP pyrophosphatase MutT (NUDIX family)